jgi:hypothetical protein
MEPNQIARIGIRLVALYAYVQGIMYLPSIYTVALNSNSGPIGSYEVVAVVSAILGPLFVGTILWIAAPRLGKWVVGPPSQQPRRETTELVQYEATAICVAGLVIVFLALPGFVSLLIQTIGGSYAAEGQRVFNINAVAYLVANSLKVLLGILLIIGVRFWVKLLRKFRQFGLEEKSSNKAFERTP